MINSVTAEDVIINTWFVKLEGGTRWGHSYRKRLLLKEVQNRYWVIEISITEANSIYDSIFRVISTRFLLPFIRIRGPSLSSICSVKVEDIFHITSVTPQVIKWSWTIKDLLSRKFYKISGLDFMGPFKGSSWSKTVTWTARPLILNWSNSTMISPIEVCVCYWTRWFLNCYSSSL